MFKTRNNQLAKANQQSLDEIELISGQEMVELDSQELMNVVGGGNGNTEDPRLIYVKSEEDEVGVNEPSEGQVKIDPYSNEIVTISPYRR